MSLNILLTLLNEKLQDLLHAEAEVTESKTETLLTYARTINEEIKIKRREFNLPID